MKLNGTHKFTAPSAQVFNAILNPDVLKNSIPGCDSVTMLDQNRIQANITTQLPGLRGPYAVVINIVRLQAPNYLELQVKREGKGGSVDAVSQIQLTDEADGALLSYDANAELSGPVAIANNPIGQSVTKSALGSFFKNLDKTLSPK